MCGRFAIAPTRGDAWASVGELLGADIEAMLAALKPQFNIAPTMLIPIVYESRKTGEIKAALARWGFVPHWAKPGDKMPLNFNCRWEGAHKKPTWRDAWASSRCLIAATHWYEWRTEAGQKTPFAHATEDGRGFMFAGVYSWAVLKEGEDPTLTAAIITRDASPSVAHIHDRMPLVLAPPAWRRWINRTTTEAGSISDILVENSMLEVRTWRVSKAVNSSRTEDEALLRPLE